MQFMITTKIYKAMQNPFAWNNELPLGHFWLGTIIKHEPISYSVIDSLSLQLVR